MDFSRGARGRYFSDARACTGRDYRDCTLGDESSRCLQDACFWQELLPWYSYNKAMMEVQDVDARTVLNVTATEIRPEGLIGLMRLLR